MNLITFESVGTIIVVVAIGFARTAWICWGAAATPRVRVGRWKFCKGDGGIRVGCWIVAVVPTRRVTTGWTSWNGTIGHIINQIPLVVAGTFKTPGALIVVVAIALAHLALLIPSATLNTFVPHGR